MSVDKKHYQNALAVQSACNLSGVVIAFAEAMKAICADPDSTGTDWRNNHPIAVLFATQVASLTKVAAIADDLCAYSEAYAICEERAKCTGS
jgi:hypothetical protein